MIKGFRHGGRFTPEYNAWCNMKARCHNVNHHKYANYGAKGIAVCERWLKSFPNFFADMGERPSKLHSVDRIDGHKGYSPENCRWATKREQAENRPDFNWMIEFNGETKSLTAWARDVGISRESLRDRFNNGWTVEAALTTPKLRVRRNSNAA